MGKTISEKIIGNKSGINVEAGQIVEANVDYVMVNDVTGLPAFEQFEKLPKGTKPLKEKIVLIPDHYVPNKDVASAEQAKRMRDFSKKYGIENYFEVGRGGVCHQLMIEKGFVAPGRLIVGADSHTCSYGALGAFSTGIGSTEAAAVMAIGKLWLKVPDSIKITVSGKLDNYVYGKDIILHVIGDIGVEGALYQSMEYYGNTIENLTLSDRISISNMAIEAGGKAGIIPADNKVFDYLKGRVRGNYDPVYSDKDAYYINELKYEAEEIPPTVAKPFLPSNTAPASEVDVEIDQAYLGSCTNGRIEDLRIGAQILKGKKINPNVRMIVVPATKDVFDQALKEGLIDIFQKANCFVCGPTCGACLGGYMGILAEGERCVATTNRNFIGRMGHKNSEVYLANPAVVTASAIEGRIVDPREVL
ncbi:MAG TPA: 3-isopropylmalate dehydratase large subunit [Methanofastidiosum sp.]|nr:3-isopropylmalate dehydratase large subunit [Methanofastidiosum sp.]HPA48733.1 3-isopropylmalate dehydratase large subunit [Methanofastidiosum sp.]HQK62007.1 3-isopropylmalate dehydratase large subunit [Methanofastidiosum sp.]HQM94116.1 3-isopropylmalate dehydratase large subunit [Methanofastidiosum sp.]HQQ48078.1 3-isopropylmalate dehydratase large subunit [Methanofastidiosum sp.]